MNKLILFGRLLLFIPFFAYSAEKNNPTTLKFVAPVSIAAGFEEVLKEIIQDFNRSHPQIKVEFFTAGESFESLKTIISMKFAGELPDFAVVNEADLPTLKKINALEKVPVSFFQNYKFLSNFVSSSVCSEEDPCSLPFQRRVPAWYFNKELLFKLGLPTEIIPTHWSELSKLSLKMKHPDPAKKESFYGLSLASSGNTALTAWSALGLKPFSQKWQSQLLDWVGLMQQNKGFWAPGSLRSQDIMTQFMSQNSVVQLSTLDRYPFLKKNAAFKFGVVLPKQGLFWFGLDFVFLTPKALSREGLEFARFLYNPENAFKLFENDHTVPASQKHMDYPKWKKAVAQWPELKTVLFKHPKSMQHSAILPQHRSGLMKVVWDSIEKGTSREELKKDIEKILSTDSH